MSFIGFFFSFLCMKEGLSYSDCLLLFVIILTCTTELSATFAIAKVYDVDVARGHVNEQDSLKASTPTPKRN